MVATGMGRVMPKGNRRARMAEHGYCFCPIRLQQETPMTNLRHAMRAATTLAALLTLGACSNAGQLGDILGGVLGTSNGTQVQGTIRGVDTRNQQLTLQQTNGQNVALVFDNNTRVMYQNQYYAVTNLEYGDQVLAHVLNNSGTYYADSIYVTQPVNGGTTTGSTASGNV